MINTFWEVALADFAFILLFGCIQKEQKKYASLKVAAIPVFRYYGKSGLFLPPIILKKMDGQYRKDIYPGLEVAIILKKDQRSGKLTYGIVKDILTSAAYHSRGIKVRLEDGQVGRVAETDVVDPDGE